MALVTPVLTPESLVPRAKTSHVDALSEVPVMDLSVFDVDSSAMTGASEHRALRVHVACDSVGWPRRSCYCIRDEDGGGIGAEDGE
jgi:hypothetical protein